MMKSIKFLIVTAVTIFFLGLGLLYLRSLSQSPELEKAICQPEDLGERYHFDRHLDTSSFPLQETIVASHTVSLVDRQLSYTVLDCSIIHYADEKAARQAFANICTDSKGNLDIGDETCGFTTIAPINLAFRRNEFLVLMSGDIGDLTSPAKAVDARLQR